MRSLSRRGLLSAIFAGLAACAQGSGADGAKASDVGPALPDSAVEARLEALQLQRQRLRAHVFPDGMPSGEPRVDRDQHDPDFAELLETARLDVLSFDASQGLSSRAYHFIPDGPRRESSVIFLLGHDGLFAPEAIVPETLLAQGVDVLMIGMVLQGPNYDDRTVELPDGSTRTLSTAHGDFAPLESEGLEAMRLFFQPLALAVEYLKVRSEKVIVAGISGGGWTADVYGAVDLRVDGVVSIAGSLPHGLRVGADVGDFEQRRERGLYDIAAFEELYLLSALRGPHRQVFHEFDKCCFDWSGRAEALRAYERDAQSSLQSLGRDPAHFEVVLLSDLETHTVHPEALEVVVELLRRLDEGAN